MKKEMPDLRNCVTCYAFRICPQKPKRENYTDENKYLIDLECGVWDCKTTVENLWKQLTQAKEIIRNLLRVTYGEGWNYSLDVKVKAEDFLKECK